jgi:hypothetical protein
MNNKKCQRGITLLCVLCHEENQVIKDFLTP